MNKKLTYTIIVILCFLNFFRAQKHELGIQLGMSNLVGDIGRTNFILQKPFRDISGYGIPFYGGIMYRRNFNPYQTLRVNLSYNSLQFDDKHAVEDYRKMRKLGGTNSVFEADLLFEYNFFPVNEEQKGMLSPYVFGGVSALFINTIQPNLTIENSAVTAVYKQGSDITMATPFGIGLKYKFNYNWALSGEFIFRPTFSDKVDYSMITADDVRVVKTDLTKEETNAVVQDFVKAKNVGNINSKDWINSAALILSYSFGRPPCYCK